MDPGSCLLPICRGDMLLVSEWQSQRTMGGGKKRREENFMKGTPPNKRFWTPPSSGTFSTPPQVPFALFFPAFSGTFPSPHIRPVFPQSEVLVKFVQETGEKCSENFAKNFADFRPSISRENVRKKFHEKSSTFSTLHQKNSFTAAALGGGGPNPYVLR